MLDWLGIGLIGGAVSSLFGAITGSSEATAQRKHDKEMYEIQKADRDRLLAEERAYNSPEAQAKRLREAGINPYHAITGATPTSAGTAVQTPEYTPNRGIQKLADLFNLVEAGRNIQMQEAQQEYLDAQKQKLLIDNAFAVERKEGERITRDKLNLINDIKLGVLEKQKELLGYQSESEKAYQEFFKGQGKNVSVLAQLLKILLPRR